MRTFVLVITIAFSGLTWAGSWGSFIGGAADAYGQQLEGERKADSNFQRENDLAEKNLERQKALLLQQHELEMKRIEREYELKSRAITSPQADPTQQLEALHPGWVRIVRSNRFLAWMAQQPPSVQQLKNSDRLVDAVLMIDLFKRDQK